MPTQDPTIIDDDAWTLAFLADLEREQFGILAAAGGAAPRHWGESDGMPARTRGGMLRIRGHVLPLAGAD